MSLKILTDFRLSFLSTFILVISGFYKQSTIDWVVYKHNRSLLLTFLETGFPGGSYSVESAGNAGDPASIPESRAPGGGNGNSIQYSSLENSMGRGAWWAIVHEVTELDMTKQLTLSLHFSVY